jgi:hypothetical protein
MSWRELDPFGISRGLLFSPRTSVLIINGHGNLPIASSNLRNLCTCLWSCPLTPLSVPANLHSIHICEQSACELGAPCFTISSPRCRMEKVKMEEAKPVDGKLEAQVKSVDMVGFSAAAGRMLTLEERRHAGRSY